jgi:hypothetical protein
VTRVDVQADELLRLFQKARNNVIYAETKMNKASSRSHSVFQIKVSKRARATDATGGKGAVKMQVPSPFFQLRTSSSRFIFTLSRALCVWFSTPSVALCRPG